VFGVNAKNILLKSKQQSEKEETSSVILVVFLIIIIFLRITFLPIQLLLSGATSSIN
jgi:hypothetical protein